jgi:hypothetical protein
MTILCQIAWKKRSEIAIQIVGFFDWIGSFWSKTHRKTGQKCQKLVVALEGVKTQK